MVKLEIRGLWEECYFIAGLEMLVYLCTLVLDLTCFFIFSENTEQNVTWFWSCANFNVVENACAFWYSKMVAI